MLNKELTNWTDCDIAMFYLAKNFGIVQGKTFLETKGILNSKNQISDSLYQILEELVKAGVLEKEEDYTQYRWNEKFEFKAKR